MLRGGNVDKTYKSETVPRGCTAPENIKVNTRVSYAPSGTYVGARLPFMGLKPVGG